MKKFNLISRLLLTILLFFILLNSILTCSKDESIIGSKPIDAYSYIGYDSMGIKINQGWIRFEFIDSIRVKGEWHLEIINNVGNIGDQNGKGVLSGGIKYDFVSLNLNPHNRDNCVFIIGKQKEDAITGMWQWITFPKVNNWGTFKAEK